MYSEFLGENYHKDIRKMLVADEELCPDSMIDADLNIGSMKMLIAQGIEQLDPFNTALDRTGGDIEVKFQILQRAARYYLAGILCVAIKSRIKSPPFNVSKYKKNWDKKRESYMARGWNSIRLLIGL